MRLPQTYTGTFYTAAARANVAPVYKTLLAALPLPSGPVNPDGLTANLTAVYSDPTNLNATSLRIDHNFTNRITFFGRYDYAPSHTATRYWSRVTDDTADTNTATLGLTILVTPTKVNDFRANWSRQSRERSAHMDSFDGGVPPAASALYPPTYTHKRSVRLYHLRLTAKSDPATRRPMLYGNSISSIPFRSPPVLTSSSLEVTSAAWMRQRAVQQLDSSLLTGTPVCRPGLRTRVGQSADTSISTRTNDYSLFAQDIWKASPSLTLTYGLRWDISTPPLSTTPGKPLYAVKGIFDSDPLALAPAGTPSLAHQAEWFRTAHRRCLAGHSRDDTAWRLRPLL